MIVTLYQTLKDKKNPDEVEANAPYPCRKDIAWLGYGYYFWDTDIDIAHWWGESYHGMGKYMICEADAIIDGTCWDIHGNGKHIKEFRQICTTMIDAGISTWEKLLVPQVIAFFQKKGVFTYSAIRAVGVFPKRVKSLNEKLSIKLKFELENNVTMPIHPPIQICLLQKKALSLRNIRIVYPLDYVESFG